MSRWFARRANDYKDYLNSVLTGTVSPDPLRLTTAPGDVGLLQFPGMYAELCPGVSLRISQSFRPNSDDPTKVTVHAYSYALVLGGNPEQDWIVRYEYELGKSRAERHAYPDAHVHFNAISEQYNAYRGGVGTARELDRIHFPTGGRISMEDFVEMLIVDFGVRPRRSLEEALVILRDSRSGFEERRTKR